MRAFALGLILTTLLVVTGCGPNVIAFSISETTESDCSQGESGQINCIDPEALQSVSRTGEWIIEIIEGDRFILHTSDGRVLPGVHFANNGVLRSDACTGQGGRCYFTRSRTDAFDSQSGCTRINERVIDIFVAPDDSGVERVTGARSEVQFVDGCEVSNIRQVLINVAGDRREAVVPEQVSP